jgi:branched-chain amino acid transport system permease protein
MVTLGIAGVLREIANRYSDLTGGADGLQGVTMEPILGKFRFDLHGFNGYVYCLVVLFLLFLLARRIVNSPFGLSLRAVKGNPLRSSAIGINVNRRLIAIYIGAVIFKLMQDWLANLTPQYWQFWIGLVLVIIVLVGRERVFGWTAPLRAFAERLGNFRRGAVKPSGQGG